MTESISERLIAAANKWRVCSNEAQSLKAAVAFKQLALEVEETITKNSNGNYRAMYELLQEENLKVDAVHGAVAHHRESLWRELDELHAEIYHDLGLEDKERIIELRKQLGLGKE